MAPHCVKGGFGVVRFSSRSAGWDDPDRGNGGSPGGRVSYPKGDGCPCVRSFPSSELRREPWVRSSPLVSSQQIVLGFRAWRRMRWRGVGVCAPGAEHGIVWMGACCAFLGQSDVGVCFLSASVVVGGFQVSLGIPLTRGGPPEARRNHGARSASKLSVPIEVLYVLSDG